VTEAARDLYLLVAVLGLLPAVSLAGMPVLAGSAFLAVGGIGALQLERAGLPIGGATVLVVVLGALAGAATGALVGRAEPPFVALSTWALAWLAYSVLLGFPSLSGGTQGLTRPVLDRVEAPFGVAVTLTPRVHLIVSAVLCALVYVLVSRVRRGPVGQDALALRDDPELAAALRVPVLRRRVGLFAIAGATGAAAGAGIAVALGVAAPADVSPVLALQLLAAAIAGGRNFALAVLVIVAVPRTAALLDDPAAGAVLTAALLLAAVALRHYVPERHARPVPAVEPAPGPPVAARGLVASGVRVELGGREILRGFDIELVPGEIHALIGPNGSGKTTALRVLAGELAARGSVEGGPVARTFQRVADLPSLAPRTQVELAVRASDPVPLHAVLDAVAIAPETDHAARAQHVLDETGDLLAVARVVATGAPVLAFDEPGVIMPAATLAPVLRKLALQGRAILVVEHDLRLVAAIADTVTVIDDGRVIATGSPEAVIADRTVQQVYLGACSARARSSRSSATTADRPASRGRSPRGTRAVSATCPRAGASSRA
jgi:ABC-type branched-subunit amino acid transport system ATPase component/ABC-type branched-subunit amino acid transport system permease subunit